MTGQGSLRDDGSEQPRPDLAGHDVVALVLAAGSGRRFGATKQLAEVDGRPLLGHVVRAAHAAEVGQVVVVVGPDADEVARAARSGGEVVLVHNPQHLSGQASSLRAGIRAVTGLDDVEVVVILLADQPGVSPEAIRSVAAAVRDGATASRASYADGPGHPVAFARRAFDRLTEVAGDEGARNLLTELGVVAVPVEGAVPVDVDTAADLDALRSGRGGSTEPVSG